MPLRLNFAANVSALTMALQIQKGANPFTYDPTQPKTIGIRLNDQASKDVLNYWADLANKGLVGKQDQFTTDYISGVVGGSFVATAWSGSASTGCSSSPTSPCR